LYALLKKKLFFCGKGDNSNLNIDMVHLAKRLQKRRIFKISQSETKVAYGGHVS
jgi:hypothetical protein